MLELVWLIPALPLLGFLLLVVGGRKLGEPRAGWLATAMMAGSFVVSVIVFLGLVGRGEEERCIVPALEAARARGIRIDGPAPGDTAFTPAAFISLICARASVTLG